MALAVLGMTHHRDPGSCSFSSFPRSTNPRISSHTNSPLCPPSSRAQGKWLQMVFCVWPFQRVCASPASFPWCTKILLLFTATKIFGFLSQFWCYGLGSPNRGLYLTLLRGNPQPLKYPSQTSSASHRSPAILSHYLYTPHQSCCGEVASFSKTSLQLVFNSGWFLHTLVVIPVWPYEEVSVASTYSSAILGSHNAWFLKDKEKPRKPLRISGSPSILICLTSCIFLLCFFIKKPDRKTLREFL